MLTLEVQDVPLFDEANNRFITAKGQILQLEHSLVSISKWEQKWKKPFLADGAKTPEETIDYIRCMTITQNVRPQVYDLLQPDHVRKVLEYIDDSATATWIKKKEGQGSSRQIITSELIYYYMVAFEIPFDPCQRWHFNRLMTLIRICDEKNNPKKMSKRNAAANYRSLNAARRARHHTRG